MIINGFQKLTLLDFPGHTACTVFTGGCNFRCPFCHNASLVRPEEEKDVFPLEDVLAFLEKRRGLLDGVAITGGEPTLQSGLLDFMARVRALGYAVKLDTNGYRPAVLRDVLDNGLADYVAMDIKSSPERYAAVAGLPKLDLALIDESRRLLMEGKTDYEFRTTVVRELHTVADIEAAARWIAGARRYFLQSFKDSGDILDGSYTAAPRETMDAMLAAARRHVPSAALRGVD